MPPAGRDRTSRRAPIKAARSLMNCSRNSGGRERRPLRHRSHGHRPHLRIQSAPAIRLETVTRVAAACFPYILQGFLYHAQDDCLLRLRQ